ncbi:MAG: SMP-30/gluconolactonase/LRE family protein [Pseudomonadota bacterium]
MSQTDEIAANSEGERSVVSFSSEGAVPGTQALRKGIATLDVIASAPAKFGDLSAATGITKGTLHRILATLIEAGLVRYDRSTHTYHLGVRLFEMAHHVWDDFDLRGAAEPELDWLSALHGESVRLSVLDKQEALCIDERSSSHELRLGNGVGSRAPLHASAQGKALLSHIEPVDRMEILGRLDLNKLTPSTITSRKELLRDCELTTARGYAIAVDESISGISSVAAAILDHRARAIGSIAILVPSYRVSVPELHALGRDVIEAARRISGNAGAVAMSLEVREKPLGADHPDVETAIVSNAFLGEGPFWSVAEKRLYWVDILAPAVMRADHGKQIAESVAVPEMVSAVVARRRGGMIAATQHGIKALDLETGAMSAIANPEAARPGNRFNDAKCDRVGRLWAGTLASDTSPGEGKLYRLDPDHTISCMDAGFHVSNGLGFSPDDRRMYFTDTGKHLIYQYDFDLASGWIENRRVFHHLPEDSGAPNGMTVDAQGFVWSALWDGWCVTRYDPDGKVERVINLPVPRPTSCIFGGPNLDILYVTSARIRLSSQQLREAPLSGSVFAINAGVSGLPETPFAG